MSSKLFVGGLSWDTNDSSLADAFQAFGSVVEAKVISDRDTGRSRGFGFVEMATRDEGQQAIEQFNGKPLKGRPIIVNEARPPARRQGNDSSAPGPSPST